MNLNERTEEFNKELERLRGLIPGLQCSNLMTCQGQFPVLIGYVDDGSSAFAVECSKEKPQILASRILIKHEELVHRLNRNIKALKEIVDE
ncbi:hypothetical protein LCGC14_1843960, partial [marine sediment metagenome]